MIRQDQCVGNFVFREEAAVVGPDRQPFVTGIDRAEESQKILPDRLRQEFAFLSRGTLQQPVRQEVGALREGDKEDAIEDFLRRLDGGERRQFRPFWCASQKADQAITQRFVIDIELVGNVLVGAVGLAQQTIGRAAKQTIGRKDKPEPRMLFRLVEPLEVEDFIGVAPAPEPVEPDLKAVRNQNPTRARRVDGIVPGLLDGAAAPTGHDPIEIV